MCCKFLEFWASLIHTLNSRTALRKFQGCATEYTAPRWAVSSYSPLYLVQSHIRRNRMNAACIWIFRSKDVIDYIYFLPSLKFMVAWRWHSGQVRATDLSNLQACAPLSWHSLEWHEPKRHPEEEVMKEITSCASTQPFFIFLTYLE